MEVVDMEVDLLPTRGKEKVQEEEEEEVGKKILPPRCDWPPAVRPSIRRKVKILEDVRLKVKVMQMAKPKQDNTPREANTGPTKDLVRELMNQLIPTLEGWFKECLSGKEEASVRQGRDDKKDGEWAPPRTDKTKDKRKKRKAVPPAKQQQKGEQRKQVLTAAISQAPDTTGRKPVKETWSSVIGRKARRGAAAVAKAEDALGQTQQQWQRSQSRGQPQKSATRQRGTGKAAKNTLDTKKITRQRPPGSAAVTFTCPSGSYATMKPR